MLKTFPYRGIPVSYRITGSGQPVVLLHGFGEDSHIFDRQLNDLRPHCRLILPDLPGSGLSPDNPEGNTIEFYAHCIHALLQYEEITRCLMLGHSMGGYITLCIGERYPELLKGFGLLHSSALADSPEKKEMRRKGIQFMQRNGAFPFLEASIPNLMTESFREANPQAVASLIEEARHFTAAACCNYYEAMMQRPDRTHVLKSNHVPVLFVMGGKDGVIPVSDMEQQTRLPECPYIHILENAAHMGMWEATETFNSHLLNYIVACRHTE